MSFLGGIRRGPRTPVPQAQNVTNRKTETVEGGSIIKSATWGRTQAGINDDVAVHIQLVKQPSSPNAVVEIVFHSPDGNTHLFDNPIAVPVSGLNASGAWKTKAPKMKDWTKGHFTFRVKLDNDMKSSTNALKLTDDPVARVVRRINSDGFDGPGR